MYVHASQEALVEVGNRVKIHGLVKAPREWATGRPPARSISDPPVSRSMRAALRHRVWGLLQSKEFFASDPAMGMVVLAEYNGKEGKVKVRW